MELFLRIYPVAVAAAETMTEFYFFRKFLDKRAGAGHYLAFFLLANALLNAPFLPVIWKYAGYLALFACFGRYVFGRDLWSSVLYAVITVEIMTMWYGVTNPVSMLCFPFLPAGMGGAGVLLMLAGSAVTFTGAFLCYRAMDRNFSGLESERKRYVLTVLLPLLMIFAVNGYIGHQVYGDTVRTDQAGRLLLAGHLQTLLIGGLGILSFFCIVYGYKKIIESFRLGARLSLLEQETLFQSRYVKEAQERYAATWAVRHDIRNHLGVVRGFLQKGEAERALAYLQETEGAARSLSFTFQTGNPVLDIVLGDKLGRAAEKGIRVSCGLRVPYPCGISDLDFCIILANALDNAVSACEKAGEGEERHIMVGGKKQGDILFVRVKNSFRGSPDFEPGLGLSNIKEVAFKYNGAMDACVQDGTFCLSVLLVIPRRPADI